MMGVRGQKPLDFLGSFKFSNSLYSWVLNDILGVTKSLSDTLQSKDIDLALAIELVDSVEKTVTKHHSGQYFHQKVWLCVLKDAEDNNV